MTGKRELAAAYDLAAEWHDKCARGCGEAAKDEPRLSPEVRERAASAEMHHKASAAGLRIAAADLRRARLYSK